MTADIGETIAALIQTVAELDRGTQIMDIELRGGKFTAARDSLAQLRAIVLLQDSLVQAIVGAGVR